MSLTITGLIVAVIAMISKGAGVEIGTEQITEFLTTGGELVGVIMIYIGRVRKGDIKFWGGKKG